jgi:hypothetical protein
MLDVLFRVLASESRKSPSILFLQNAEILIGDAVFQKKLIGLKGTVVVIASHAAAPEPKPIRHKENSDSGLLLLAEFLTEKVCQHNDVRSAKENSWQMLSELFTCSVTI